MPRRTQVFTQLPWAGGLNSSLDSGLIPTTDLVVADNITFASTGVREKRDGFAYWDAVSDIPAVTHRSSSGTTRTLVFAATLSSGTVDKLVSGEGIIVTTTTTSGNEYTYYKTTGALITALSTTTVTNDTLTYTAVGSLTEGSTATSTATVTRQYPTVRLVDYWYFSGSAMTQKLVAATSQPLFFSYDSSGNRKQIAMLGGATARVGTAAKMSEVVFNNRLIIGMDRVGNKPIIYDPASAATWTDLAGTPPDFSIAAIHLSRIWTNDKNMRDRLHYSATSNHEKWQGADDSGAIDIRPGDGDPVGITAVFPFKGRLFVAKSSKLYQVVGDSPENFQVIDVSSGLGAASHLAAVAVDQDDVLFVSSKGVHSIAASANYGDFNGAFLSKKIQPSFNNFKQARLVNTQAVYIQPLNSVAFTVAEASASEQDMLWLYNIQAQEWYRWPNVSCQTIANVLYNNVPTLFIGTAGGKIIRTQTGLAEDFGSTGIRYSIKSGTIYPDQDPLSIKAFKRLTLFYRPDGTYSVTVRVQIDNFQEQALGFSQNNDGDVLDSTFILGQSLLGASAQFAPFTLPIDGYGRGITIEVEQAGADERIAIYGFSIEFEVGDVSQETVLE